MAEGKENDEMISAEQLCKHWGITMEQLEAIVESGALPAYTSTGERVQVFPPTKH